MSDHTSIVEHMNEILTPWKPAWNTDPMPRGTADEIIWTGTPSKSRGARRRSLRPRARDCRPSGSAAPPGHDRLGQSRPQAPPPPAEEEVIAKLSEHGQRRSPRQGRSSLPRLLWQAAITGGVSEHLVREASPGVVPQAAPPRAALPAVPAPPGSEPGGTAPGEQPKPCAELAHHPRAEQAQREPQGSPRCPGLL